MRTLNILFEDGEALVVDKPSGLPVDCPRTGGVSMDEAMSGNEREKSRALDVAQTTLNPQAAWPFPTAIKP